MPFVFCKHNRFLFILKESKVSLKNPFDKKDDPEEDINILTSNDPWNVDTSKA